MIITVTPNPAWDVTYEVPALVPGEVHRVTAVHRRLGGKGVNVARVLAALGREAVALLPGPGGLAAEAGLGGPAGDRGRPAGEGAGAPLACDVVPGLPAIRQTLVVHGGDGITTSLWEPGVEPDPGTGAALADRFRAWLREDGHARPGAEGIAAERRTDASAPPPVSGAVISGSLPPGLDSRLHARLAVIALDAGVPAVVDTSGEALAHAAMVPGVVLAPNASELAQLIGTACDELAKAVAAARTVLSGHGLSGNGLSGALAGDAQPGGPRAVVVTLGEDGLVAVTEKGAWHGRLDRPLAGNPTGAGDAAAAALIAGLADTASWPDVVRDAVALSAAAVLSPVAGEVSPADFARLRAGVAIREVA
ncbi:MAG TPA: PfkB family carbohydrate kinase [Trebonia sp.]